MKTSADLEQMLRDIDRKSYPAYKTLKGSYRFHTYILSIDHVQGDPFASPSRLTIRIDGKAAGFSEELWMTPDRMCAFCDFLLRRFEKAVLRYSFQAKGSGKSGAIFTTRCGQTVLRRTGCSMEGNTILMRFEAGFPANGRTINAKELRKILFDYLPRCVSDALYKRNTDEEALTAALELYEDQQALRRYLSAHDLCAFVADGSILPRTSGVSDTPLAHAVPFKSPASLSVTIPLPHRGSVNGMGIRRGITLITGGGYHGKSTLLKALEAGVYNHIAGDGREFVVTDASAVKLRAEEGRSVRNVDISPFINHLPGGKDTTCFSTADASGSTSQAAGVMEGIESGSRLFLIDEDTCATNFMVRDELMKRVIAPDKEPITPFLARIRPLFTDLGISTILVVGSSGAFFQPADCVIQMDQYEAHDITERAHEEAERFYQTGALSDGQKTTSEAAPGSSRAFSPGSETHFPSVRLSRSWKTGNNRHGSALRPVKIRTQGTDGFSIDKEFVDLRYVEQLSDEEQVRALGHLLLTFLEQPASDKPLTDRLTALYKQVTDDGLESVTNPSCPPFMAMPRLQELFACVNRFRG